MYLTRSNPYIRHVNTETNIQGDSERIANIFCSDYNCYDNKEIYFNMCIILNGYGVIADRIC